MLRPNEVMDVPEIDNGVLEQQKIRALGITLGQFCKTLRGRTLILNDKHFVLNGQMYQGFNERALECTEDMLTPAEIENAEDIDGTKQRILDTRARRIAGNQAAKEQELGKRRQIKIAQERDELELRRLQREEAAYLAKQGTVEAVEEIEPEPVIHACSHAGCGKTFETAAKLNAHRMGAKHR